MASVMFRFKTLHPDAMPPLLATAGSAGVDLSPVSYKRLHNGLILFGTGLALELGQGYFGLLCNRSSNCLKGFSVAGGCQIIDSDYRGEVKIPIQFRPGYGLDVERFIDEKARIAQLVIIPTATASVKWTETDELSVTERGSGGFGSTGR